MKKVPVFLPEELQHDLKELARRRETTVAELVRLAVEQCYQDELDGLLMERELEGHAGDPSSSVTLDEYLARRRDALHS